MVYLITCDLAQTGQNYESIVAAIKSASTGKWCSYWKSSWLIQSTLPSAYDVFALIQPYIDSDDQILVVEATDNKLVWGSQAQRDYIIDEVFE